MCRTWGITTYLLCDRSGSPTYKAGWRCRSLHQSSASASSRTSLVFLLAGRRGAAIGSTNRFTAMFQYIVVVLEKFYLFCWWCQTWQTCLWHLNFPDDDLRGGGHSVIALAITGTHRAAAVYRVHAVHIRAWTHTHTVLHSEIYNSLHQAWWEQMLMNCTKFNSKETDYDFPKIPMCIAQTFLINAPIPQINWMRKVRVLAFAFSQIQTLRT